MKRFVLSSLIAIGAIAASCGPRARSAEPERRKVVEGPPVQAILDVKIRDGIEFNFRVMNNQTRKLELLFPSGQTHDIAVVDSLGREVWRWSEGRMFTQAFSNRVVEPLTDVSWQAAWRADVPPGHYVAVATLMSENRPLEHRVEFDVR